MLRHAPLALVTALLCFRLGPSSAAAAQTAPAFVRDPLLDVALPGLLSHPLGIVPSPFDAQLQLASAQCRERSVSSRTDSESQGSDDREEIEDDASAAKYCKQVRYVRHARERLRAALQAELLSNEQAKRDSEEGRQDEASEQQQTETKRLPQKIATRSASGVDLQEFFEMYAETARPVILTATEGDATTSATVQDGSHELLGFANDEELTQFRDKCFGPTPSSSSSNSTTQATLPLKIHDAECAPFLKRFRVPIFLVHDYIRRTDVSISDAYLPSLVHVQPQQSAQKVPGVFGCPHGLHMLAMVFPDTTDSSPGFMDIQVFDQHFKPLPQRSRERKASEDVEEVAISASSGGVFGRDLKHFDNNFLAQVTPLHHAQELPVKSFLFVPGSQFATLRPTSVTHGDNQHPQPKTTLLRFCFVDASNFNAVKQEVAIEALVSSEAQTLLQSLQSQVFDRSMFRRPAPKDSLWQNFITWPKETKLLKKSDLLNSEAGSEQLQLSRRERLKQWQDDKRWDRRVEPLTLPVSLPPVVINMTRNSATLRFQDLYDLPKHDITTYGYVIRWKNVDKEQELPVLSLAGDDNSEPSNEDVMSITRQQIVRSVLPTALFGDDFDGKDIEAVVLGLEAETKYTFTVQIYVDETSGLESDSSRIAQTTACSEPSGARGVPIASDGVVDATCTTLRWLDPIDDGGKQIGLYLISARIVEDAFDALAGRQDSTKTVEDEKVFTLEAKFAAPSDAGGAWKTAQVCKLMPGATYLFRVAAMNSIGVGPWSSRSDPAVIPSQSPSLPSSSRRAASVNVPTLKGKGDPDYVPMRSFSLHELTDLIVERGPEVVLATLSEASVDKAQLLATHPLKIVLSDVHEKIVLKSPVAAKDKLQFEANNDGSVSGSEASFDVWSSHYSPRSFHVSSEVVRADPLDASTPLRNADQVKDRVILVARGTVPFVFKVHYAQLAGALGIIIADVNDTCQGRFDQRCVPGAGKSRGKGFAAQDRHELWAQNRIPCVLALQDASQRLLELVAP